MVIYKLKRLVATNLKRQFEYRGEISNIFRFKLPFPSNFFLYLKILSISKNRFALQLANDEPSSICATLFWLENETSRLMIRQSIFTALTRNICRMTFWFNLESFSAFKRRRQRNDRESNLFPFPRIENDEDEVSVCALVNQILEHIWFHLLAHSLKTKHISSFRFHAATRVR